MSSSLSISTPATPPVPGRATQGSRRQLQDYVNRLPLCLNEAIGRALPQGARETEHRIQWLSPLAGDDYREYRDRNFLEQIGLVQASSGLKAFWPPLGPCWDGLGLLIREDGTTPEILLVEAKSELDEFEGTGCRAAGEDRAAILEAFGKTQQWLGAQPTPAWTGPLYRSANRLAHLCFLRTRTAVGAWLVQVYFLNDPIGPSSRADWLPAIASSHARLGLRNRPPYTLEVFLPALNPR